MAKTILNGIVKSRYSREKGNPENSNYMKIPDSCWSLSRTLIRDRNDKKFPFKTFYGTIILKKQDGMVLVIALMMLLILTIIGINAINTTIFETSISGNQRIYNAAFYGADGGIDDFRARAWRDPQIMDGTKTSYSETIPGSNITYNITSTYLGEVNRGGVPYQAFRVNSEGVAPNFPFAGRVSVETIEEIDSSGGGNVSEVRKYN